MYGRRKLTPEETLANAQARAARRTASMTCQCCGRAILANTGTIAHHGYERPDAGYQTRSCMGAKALPFEVSRLQLGELIDFLKQMVKRNTKHVLDVSAERAPVAFSYTVRDRTRWTRTQKTTYITRGWFLDRGVSGPSLSHLISENFDQIKSRYVTHLQSQLANLRTDVAEQQKRYDGWTQTHKREGNLWLPI